jgi:hypothetical protein
MATRPTQYIDWCPDGDPTKIILPPSAISSAGYVGGEPPIAQHFNWLLYTMDQWIQWLDQAVGALQGDGTFTGIRPASMRAINGGTWAWNATTGILSWSAAWQLAIPGLPASANNIIAGSVTLADGQVAYVVPNVPHTAYGNTTSGSSVIANVDNTNGLSVGMAVYGPQIPAGAVVSAISGSTLTMSMNATGTVSGAYLTFGFSGNLSTYVFADSAFVAHGNPKVVFARRSGNYAYVGIGGTMLMFDGQQRSIFDASPCSQVVAGEAIAAGQVVYISVGASDGSRTAGRAYKADAGATNGALRSSVAGVAINGASAGSTLTIVTSGAVPMTSLTAGATYYLDPANPGQSTTTAPTTVGQYSTKVGVAASSSLMLLRIDSRSAPGVVSASYRTHVANAFISKDGTSPTYNVTAGAADGSILIAPTSAGTLFATLPLRIPDNGTLTSITIDITLASGALTNWQAYVNRNRNGTVSTIAGGGFSGMGTPTSLGGGVSRYNLGTLAASDLASGDKLYMIIRWDSGVAGTVSFYEAIVNLNTAAPAIVAG